MEEPQEHLLATYTEDLLADRRPRLPGGLAALAEAERRQILGALTLLRRLKGAHTEVPRPSEEFLQRLDARVRQEIENRLAEAACAGHQQTVSPQEGGVATSRPAAAYRRALAFLFPATAAGRWRFAGIAVLGVVLALQVQLSLHVRRLESQNQALVSRLTQAMESRRVQPLSLDRLSEGPDHAQSGGLAGQAPVDDLLRSVEFRRKAERRIRELQEAVATKSGTERKTAEMLLRELQELLRR
jgi:hypothetical protein